VLRIVRPDKRVLPGSVAGAPDTNFQAVWLIDGRPSYPYKKTGGISVTVTPDVARTYDVIGVTRHLVPAAGTVTVNGHVVTMPAYGGDGLSRAGSLVITPESTGASFAVSTSGTTIGDLWVGESFTLNDFQMRRTLAPSELVPWEAALGPYIDGYSEIQTVSGLISCTNAQFAQVVAWSESTRKGALPSLVIFDEGTWLCLMKWTEAHWENQHGVQLTLVKFPDTDW